MNAPTPFSLIALAALVLGAGVRPLEAQVRGTPSPAVPTPSARLVRVSAGLGPGSVGAEDGAVGGRFGVTVATAPERFVTVRTMGLSEFTILGGANPPESVWDVGVLYGAQKTRPRSYASAAAGLSLAGGMRRGALLPSRFRCDGYGLEALGCALAASLAGDDYEEDPFLTVGVPVEVELGWTPTRGFGMAVTAFANLNLERSAIGASLSVLVGRIR